MSNESAVTSYYNHTEKLADTIFEGRNINTDITHFAPATSSLYSDTVTRVSAEVSTHVVQQDLPFLPWDNPGNLISLEASQMTRFAVHGVLNPILILVGAPTNIISCLVFYKQGLRDRMNLCLFVLALVDACYILSYVTACVRSYVRFWDEDLEQELYVKSVVYISFVTFAMRAASGCITMVVAVERCVCVVFPLRANSIMRTRTMGALLTAIVIALTLAFSIINLRNRVAEVRDEESGKAHHQILVTDFFSKHPLIYEILFNLILSIVVPIVTFVVVGVATAITVIKLRTAIAWRASTSSGRGDNRSQQQQAALTKMLVILSCVFMVFSTPGVTLRIVGFFVSDFRPSGRYSNIFYASFIVSYHLLNINSTINFFVYYFRSSRFKRDLRTICCRRNAKQRSTSGHASVTKPSEF